MIVVKVRDRDIKAAPMGPVTTGSVGLPVSWHFSEEWDDLAKTAVFRVGNDGTEITVAVLEDLCLVPDELLVQANAGENLWIGVYGWKGTNANDTIVPEIAMPTIWTYTRIQDGSQPSGIEPPEGTPGWSAQIQNATDEALRVAHGVAADAAEGDFDGISPAVTISSITHGHSVNITDRDHPTGQSFNVMDGDSAYEQAVAGGYTGTEEQFNEELASFKGLSEQAADSASTAAGAAYRAQNYERHAGDAEDAARAYADIALIRMNSADASAQAAATTATTFTEQTVPAAVNTINEAKADAISAVGNAQTTAVGAVQQESTTQQAAIQQKGEDVLDSIPADYTELSEDVAELQSAVSLESIALQYTSGGTGYVKHADGAIGTSTLSSHTDYVDISGYPYLYYKRQGSAANNPTAGMAFYDESKTYICGEPAVARQGQSGYMANLKKIAVPGNAKYARFTTYTDETTYGAFEVYGESIIVDKVNENSNIITSLLPESLPFSLISGQYIYTDGSITVENGWYITDYIDVTGIDKIIYTRIATPGNWAGYGIAWFDVNKELIPNTGTGAIQFAENYSYVLTVKDVPSGAKYVRMSAMDRDNLNLPFGVYDYAKYEKALIPSAKRYAPVVGSPRLYLATTPVDPDFDIRSSSSGGTSYSDIYGRYDALCASYPHWIKRDTDIGVDSENNPIARYTLRMYDPLVFLGDGVRTPPFTNNVWENSTQYRRALLTAGVHGNERVGVMGLYYLIKDILSSNDEWARYIKSNYILEIIPIINPGGFNANRRRNGNNIDINRDYMKKTSVEAQVMTTFIQSIKNDLYCAMDFHGSYELGFLATPQNSHIINKMMTLATQTISACADDWEGIESIIGNTSDYYPYAYGCLSQNSGTLPYYILMNNITPYAFTVESPCLLLDTTVQANSAKVVAAAKMAMDQGCNVLQALLCI